MRSITKERFESLLGFTISDSDFYKVRTCFEVLTYIWKDEDGLVWSFRKFGMDHINDIYSMIVRLSEKYGLGYGMDCDDAPVEEAQEDKSVIEQPVDMAALKEHFESLTNCTVTDNEYYRIEKCIDAFSGLLASDDDIALFYHTFGINGIDHLLCDAAGYKVLENHLREKAYKEHRKYLNLRYKYNRLNSHTVGFVQALSKFFKEILDDPVFNSDLTSYKLAIRLLVDYFDNDVLRHESFESEVE